MTVTTTPVYVTFVWAEVLIWIAILIYNPWIMGKEILVLPLRNFMKYFAGVGAVTVASLYSFINISLDIGADTSVLQFL